LDYFHVIDLPDDTATPGNMDLRDQPAYLGLDRTGVFKDKTVLDIGANDGFWSFWAEKQGDARDVLAIDVEDYRSYDWGHAGPPKAVEGFRQPDKSHGFYHLHKLFESRVRRERLSVYQLDPTRHGEFDFVIFYGVLYHLRHPLFALDQVRRVCRGAALVETHVCAAHNQLPMSLFYEDDVYSGPTNWCGPTEACVVHWMRNAGFPIIFAERQDHKKKAERQRFIGVVDPSLRSAFADNPHFFQCDADYFARSRAELVTLLATFR
jgi:tRNA (mo5U34)-methyltransferase